MFTSTHNTKSLWMASLLFIVFPTALAFIYYSWVATRFYEAEAKFAVQAASDDQASNIFTIENYIRSREAFAHLNHDFNFIDLYQSKKIDFLNRLSSTASFEDAYKYYLKMIEVRLDTTSKIGTLRIKAISPQIAKAEVDALLRYAASMISKLSENFKDERLRFAKHELQESEELLAAARASIPKHTNKNSTQGDINSQSFAKVMASCDLAEENYRAAAAFLASIRMELSKQRAEIVVLVSPNEPYPSPYPNVLRDTASVFLFLTAVFGILCLLGAIAREHIGV